MKNLASLLDMIKNIKLSSPKLKLILKKIKDIYDKGNDNIIWQKIKKLIEKHVKKKKLLQKKRKELSETKEEETSKEKETSNSKDKSISYISELLDQYENFIKQDLTILIQQNNAFIRHLKQEIINNPKHNLERFDIELIEITRIYHDSEVMMERCINNYYNYEHKVIELQPGLENKLTQSHLTQVVKDLKKAHHMIDLSKNDDYNFVTEYLKEQHKKGRSIA